MRVGEGCIVWGGEEIVIRIGQESLSVNLVIVKKEIIHPSPGEGQSRGKSSQHRVKVFEK